MKDESVKRQALKIRLFDGLFRSSDNILRNILVNQSHELLSIDEGISLVNVLRYSIKQTGLQNQKIIPKS